jgi:hypothetical protein
MQLLGHPVHDISKSFGDSAGISTCFLSKHLTVAIALDKLDGDREIQQTRECFAWHRTGNNIASNHDLVYLRLANVLEHGLMRREAPMNIIECSETHTGPSSAGKARH